jgi:O-antigen ligase
MITALEKKWIQVLLIIGTVGVSLFLTPSFSTEPVDLPKLFVLVIFAGLILGFISSKLNLLISAGHKVVAIIIGLFLAQLSLVLAFSSAPFNQQFFGTSGRNTGYLAYFALLIFFVAGILVTNEFMLNKLSNWLYVTGILSALYGLLQITKHDPINWNNPYNPIISFLGNPDFESAFLGISATVGFALILKPGQKIATKILMAGYQIFAFLLIIKSHAQQGVLVFGLAAALVVVIYLYKNVRVKNVITLTVSGSFGLLGLVALLGIFKIGPLASHLYKFSVRQRGFYWHAALEMAKSHPFLGIGMDSYGDNYFRYRSANAAFFSMPTQSNAAHNVYLDLAANGGFPLLFLYIALNLLVLFYGIKTIKNLHVYNPYFTAVFVAWIGYQIQSIVSINNLGLAVWGWVLGGAVVGFGIKEDHAPAAPGKKLGRMKKKNRVDLLSPSIGFIVGLAIAVPPFMADHNYRIAAASQNANNVIAAASAYPEDLERTLSIAHNLASAKLFPQALKLAESVASKSPKNYNSWVLISQLTQPGTVEHAKAILKMQQLNPQDKSIK